MNFAPRLNNIKSSIHGAKGSKREKKEKRKVNRLVVVISTTAYGGLDRERRASPQKESPRNEYVRLDYYGTFQ